MSKRIVWHLEVRQLIDLIPYDKNPRIITKVGLDELKKSFDEIGYAQPININLNNKVLSGNARYQQLKKEGVKEVECYVPNVLLTPKQEEAVIIRMNKNIAGEWDFDKLANEFEIDNLLDWGFTSEELSFEKISPIESELPELSSENPDCQTVTFVLSNEQKDLLDEALDKAKSEEDCSDELNQNSNGNKLSAILRRYVYG